jgi:hypothetical protein
VHGLGAIHGRRGGSRVDVRLVLPQRTKFLVGLFFVLYVVVAMGIATQPPRAEVSIEEVAIAVGGAVVLGAIFTTSAARQRAQLRRFLEQTYSDVPRL